MVSSEIYLVTGGHGFIGSHVVEYLRKQGKLVRVVDLVSSDLHNGTETMIGNLCDLSFCHRVVQNVHSVLHFAATMGGMGTIHSTNDFTIYSENHVMTMNLLHASILAGIHRFLYASSACVYPESLQYDQNADVSLRENDVWANPPPRPQGLYGLEKLVSELLLKQYATSALQVRIARFHNVFGPGGAWCNGREKAPAALLRKAIAAGMERDFPTDLEVWGDGLQRRSFLWIEDCVKAIILLLNSDCAEPVNIGSDQSICINDLAEMALRSAKIDRALINFSYNRNSPVGVASRNSNNDLVLKKLGWKPTTLLQEGMNLTAEWIRNEMKIMLDPMSEVERKATLVRFRRSEIVDLQSEGITFAVLLPITSRGSERPERCLENLACFVQSLLRTTRPDVKGLGGLQFRLRVYLAIDHDDIFLLSSPNSGDKASAVVRNEGIPDVQTLICNYPRGAVCSLWRHCARRAWEDKCDYFALFGDDVVLEDIGWLSDAHNQFVEMHKNERQPLGFGCIAFTDTTFPGMPTFPIVHRTHMDIFNGEVVPKEFVNQDGDPYLFQLYRRWGCSHMFNYRIRNEVGGKDMARYEKKSAPDWTFEILEKSTISVESWLHDLGLATRRKLTLDVIVPSYRVQPVFLDRILRLKASKNCTTMFIIIVDDPSSPQITYLQHNHSHRPDVRIRSNKENLGASASRNKGMAESAAEWALFLDDDVIPHEDVLIEAEKIIRAHPNAAGFIGNTQFPPADTVFTAAVHLAGVTYFWDIATKMANDLPWGVTANLIARRNIKDNVEFDLCFPKSGGGEDIDFCRKKRAFFLSHGWEGFWAAPKVIVNHPWWSDGQRSYWRFYMWSYGDGALIKKYPEYSYRDIAPNSAELMLLCAVTLAASFVEFLFFRTWRLSLYAMKAAGSVMMSNIFHDCYRHLWRDTDRIRAIPLKLGKIALPLAVVESSLIRMISEAGRTAGLIKRNEWMYLGSRFDWFTGRAGRGPMSEEKFNNFQRSVLCAVFLSFLLL